MCSECREGVCDDCAAYKKESCSDPKKWKCSFCIRRQERINAEAASGIKRTSSSQDLPYSLRQSFSNGGRNNSVDSLHGPHSQKSPPLAERMRRASSSRISPPEGASSTFLAPSSRKLSDVSKSNEPFRSEQRSPSSRPSSMDHSDMGRSQTLQAEQGCKPKSPPSHMYSDHSSQKSSRREPPQHHFTSSKVHEQSSIPARDSHSSAANFETSGLMPSGPKLQKHMPPLSKDFKSITSTLRSGSGQRKALSPADKSMSYNAPEPQSSRLEFHRASMPGILVTDRASDISAICIARRANDRPRLGDMPYHDSYSSSGEQGICYITQPYRKDGDKLQHPSSEGCLRERKMPIDTQKGMRTLPQPQHGGSSHSPSTSPSRFRMSSASESSVEDKSPEEDSECRRRNRMRRTRFQRQKTFIDEHDSEIREEWMKAHYASNAEEMNSSFDSSSAFESFDTDVDAPIFRRSHGYPQAPGRAVHHMSDTIVYRRRRSSDSSEFSDLNADMAAYRRQLQGATRKHISRRSDYDADMRYQHSSQVGASGLDDPGMRAHMEKSLSVDDPEMMGIRKGQRKMPKGPTDDRRRLHVHDHSLDLPRKSPPNAYQYGGPDPRGFQTHQGWTRCAKSLEISMDAPEVRRCSLNEGDRIKIVIDDVDAGAKGYQVGNHIPDMRSVSRRNFQERGVKSLDWNESLDWPYEDTYDSYGDSARSLTVNARHKASSATDVSRDIDYHQSPTGRRRLPMTPDQSYHGEIGIRIHYDPKRTELAITIAAAKGLRRQKASGNGPRAFAKLRLTPYSGFRPMETHIAEPTGNPEWNKTCVFPGLAMDDLYEKVVELIVFDAEQGIDKKVLLGSVTVSLRNADFNDSLRWYPLSQRSTSLLSHPHKASSTGMLVSTPAHDIARRLLSRGTQREMLQSQSLTDEGPVECYDGDDDQALVKSTSMDSTRKHMTAKKVLHPDDVWDQENQGDEASGGASYAYQRGASNERISHDVYPLAPQDSLPDMYCSDLEPLEWQKQHVVSDLRSVNSDTEAGSGALRRQRQRNSFLRRRIVRGAEGGKSVEHAARSVVIGGSSTDTEPSQSVDNPSYVLPTERRNPSILKNANPPSKDEEKPPPGDNTGKNRCGELKLGFSLQKGHLHIEVIKARGIRLAANGLPPDTYVKTYLKNGDNKTMKRKTSVVRQSTEPRFHQTIKYAVGDINRKVLLVMIWERHKRFEHNQAIGIVELDLGKMKLTKPFVGWYQLKPLRSTDSESVGSS